MFCASCDFENRSSANFCAKCGQRLTSGSSGSNVAATSASHPAGRPAVSHNPPPPVPRAAPSTPQSTATPVVSRLKLSRGMIVSGALLLLFLFWSPLVSCTAGPFGPQSISGAQLVEATLQTSSSEQFGEPAPTYFLILVIIPLTALLFLVGTGLALFRNAPSRPTIPLALFALAADGLVLAGLWLYIKRANAEVTGTFTYNLLSVTGNYWLMWLSLAVVAAGYWMERTVARSRAGLQ